MCGVGFEGWGLMDSGVIDRGCRARETGFAGPKGSGRSSVGKPWGRETM